MRQRIARLGLLALTVCLMIGCHKADPGAADAPSDKKAQDAGVLNLFWWSDFMAADTIPNFEKNTGIRVRLAYFDTNETLEVRLLTGNSGFDAVDPTASFFQRQIRSGAYLSLDKSKLPNYKNLNPEIMEKVALNDPNNAHGIVYAWGTYGVAYNEALVSAAMPGVPLDSWRLLFDPAYASKLAKCGIGTLDSPAPFVRVALKYLRRNPNEPTEHDLADLEKMLGLVRPYFRTIDSSNIIESLANGDICIAFDSNGDAVQARNRAIDVKNGVKIAFVIPNEGSMLWFDMAGIPRDAPNVDNAYRFLDYLMDPAVSASFTNHLGYANANAAATQFLKPAIATDKVIYPTPNEQRRLVAPAEDSPEQARAITRLWQKFKTGQ